MQQSNGERLNHVCTSAVSIHWSRHLMLSLHQACLISCHVKSCVHPAGFSSLRVMWESSRMYYPVCHVCIQQDLLSYVSYVHPKGLTIPCVMCAPRRINFAYVFQQAQNARSMLPVDLPSRRQDSLSRENLLGPFHAQQAATSLQGQFGTSNQLGTGAFCQPRGAPQEFGAAVRDRAGHPAHLHTSGVSYR